MVQERGEPRVLVRCCHSAHTIKRTWRALPDTVSGARFASRVPPRPVRFPPPPPQPRLGRCSAASQVLPDRPTSHDRPSRDYGPWPSPHDPPLHHDTRVTVRSPGSQHEEITHMHGFFDPAGPDDGSRKRRHQHRLPLIHSTSASR
jgi:hypothetical protein